MEHTEKKDILISRKYHFAHTQKNYFFDQWNFFENKKLFFSKKFSLIQRNDFF